MINKVFLGLTALDLPKPDQSEVTYWIVVFNKLSKLRVGPIKQFPFAFENKHINF